MSDAPTTAPNRPNTSLLLRGAIWIAIGALIAAAFVCVVWVLIGDQDGLVGRAFLTIFLLAAFAGVAIAETGLAPNRPDWLALTSMITWIIALLVGAVKIWLPESEEEYYGLEAARFLQFLLVVGILQLALLHVRLYLKAARRHVTAFTRGIVIGTLVLLGVLVALLVFALTFPHTFEYGEFYWRIVVAVTILVAVGTTLIPLLNALFAPKRQPAPAAAPTVAAWPTYADGRTPLPVMPDGSPDWNAYYTGYPTYPAVQQPLQSPAPAATPAAETAGHPQAQTFAGASSAYAGPPSPGFPPPPPAAPQSPPAAAPEPPAAPQDPLTAPQTPQPPQAPQDPLTAPQDPSTAPQAPQPPQPPQDPSTAPQAPQAPR
ncbi:MULTISPECIES: hypothetical protein [Microbacterium]|uniref:hypothetical protein n=1 Tax=Microbacterium TaxID=33882 RepID=UPI00217CDCE3|nr:MULTISPECIES: hypothetical protein [Microbacterium]UWF77867.1 hypothetical protein JSY13_02030 [Microbacterium neungamense]WCM56043.1 hypothetical protein JRG78_02070 [Microbacterium sp. EF45047]